MGTHIAVGRAALEEHLSRHLSSSPIPPHDIHILLVDDERLSRVVVGNLLRKCHYRVSVASSGQEAVEILQKAERGAFHLILTDVMMPDVDGIGLLRFVRSHDVWHNIPVVMMSANEASDTVFECIRGGAEDYLLKPVTRKEVQYIWQHVWRRSRWGASTNKAPLVREEVADKGSDTEAEGTEASTLGHDDPTRDRQESGCAAGPSNERRWHTSQHVGGSRAIEAGPRHAQAVPARTAAALGVQVAPSGRAAPSPPAALGMVLPHGRELQLLGSWLAHPKRARDPGTATLIFCEVLQLLKAGGGRCPPGARLCPSGLVLLPLETKAAWREAEGEADEHDEFYAEPAAAQSESAARGSDGAAGDAGGEAQLMFSLGTLLFELWHVSGSPAARRQALRRLQQQRLLPYDMQQQYPVQAGLVLDLTQPIRRLRPSLTTLMKHSCFTETLVKLQRNRVVMANVEEYVNREVLLDFLLLTQKSVSERLKVAQGDVQGLDRDIRLVNRHLSGLRRRRRSGSSCTDNGTQHSSPATGAGTAAALSVAAAVAGAGVSVAVAVGHGEPTEGGGVPEVLGGTSSSCSSAASGAAAVAAAAAPPPLKRCRLELPSSSRAEAVPAQAPASSSALAPGAAQPPSAGNSSVRVVPAKRQLAPQLPLPMDAEADMATEPEGEPGSDAVAQQCRAAAGEKWPLIQPHLGFLEERFRSELFRSQRVQQPVPEPEPAGAGEGEGSFPPRLADMAEELGLLTQHRQLHMKVAFHCGDISHGSSRMVCGIACDRDDQFFATASVGKSIKIYEFESVMKDGESRSVHCPILDISSRAKLSCVCWNWYLKNYLLFADYDGVVQLWDVAENREVVTFEEHAKRAWATDFCPSDPTRFASCSDDGTVRLWSITSEASVGCIDVKSNVCSVQFSPSVPHLLALSTASNQVFLYDQRRMSNELVRWEAHKKPVSYVHFMGGSRLVTASTDGSLKLWDVSAPQEETPTELRRYSGHQNDKNFIGLSVTPSGEIACGSEVDAVYCYHHAFPMPLGCVRFPAADHPLGAASAGPPARASHAGAVLAPAGGPGAGAARSLPAQAAENRASDAGASGSGAGAGRWSAGGKFVSSVCWTHGGNYLVAGNSAGIVGILEMR